MKILLIAFEFPPQGGGIGSFAFQMAKNWSEMNVDVTALVITNQLTEGEIKKFDDQQKFNIIRFKSFNLYILNVFYRIFYSLKLIFDHHYDLIYCAQFSTGLIGLLSKMLLRIPYVMVGHGSEAFEKNKLRFFTLKSLYRFSDLVVVNSSYTLKQFRENNIYNKNTKLIMLGGDDTLFNPNNLEKKIIIENQIKKDTFIVLTVGTLSERKNHKVVIDAIKSLVNENLNIMYMIVGTGPLYNKLKNQIKELEIENNVNLVGYINEEILPYYYQMSDLFILNSKIAENGDVEGFGIVLIEANLMGKPVIGTKNSGMEDAIEDNKSGYLIDADSSEETAKAIKRVYLNDSLRKKMGEYGRKRALKYFTWQNTAKNILSEIKIILK